MKFNCNDISICDEELGCTLTLSEINENETDQSNMSMDEIISSSGKYLMLQRTYPEDEFEEDYYYIEFSDFDKSGELKDFKINLSASKLILNYHNELIEIDIKPDFHEFESLKQVLLKITNGKGEVNIYS